MPKIVINETLEITDSLYYFLSSCCIQVITATNLCVEMINKWHVIKVHSIPLQRKYFIIDNKKKTRYFLSCPYQSDVNQTYIFKIGEDVSNL